MKPFCRVSFLGLSLVLAFAGATIWPLTARGAAPIISGVDPKAAVAGTTVNLRGTDFSTIAAENIIYFGAVRGMVTSARTTNLQVTAPAGATFSPITVTVNGLTAASAQPFLPTFPGAGSPIGSTTLTQAFTLPASLGPNTIVFADLDNDGRPDIIIGNGGANSISILRNLSTNSPLTAASFDTPIEIPFPPAGPYKIRAADIDGDGKLDLLVAAIPMAQVSILRNTTTPGGPITFAPRVDLPTGADCRFARAADLDGDGKLDIVTANYGGNTISILKNIGAPGAITPDSFAPRIDLPTPAGPYEIAIGDLDGDGRPDIAVATYAQLISVYRNASATGVLDTNSFARVDFPAPAQADSIELGDVDGDGLLDVVIGSVAPYTVAVYRNLGITPFSTNSLDQRVEFNTGHWVHNVTLADFDGDGKPDIALDGELASYLSIYQNLATPGAFSTGSLGPRVDFATGWNAWGLAVGDLDGDGRPDAALANHWDSTFTVYQNMSLFSGPPIILSQPFDQIVALGDPAFFAVTAQGTPSLAYQWLHGDLALPGATNSTLTFAEVSSTDAGSYSVVVTNAYGAVTSAPAMLVLTNVAPYITVQPQDVSVMRDNTAVFSVTARGSHPLFYQWSLNGTNLDGGTTSALTLLNVQRSQAGRYSVLVSNDFGSVTSRQALLTVRIPPSGVAVVPTTNTSGWPITVPIQLNASGEENAVSFSILFGGTQRLSPLRFIDASAGAGAAGAWIFVNTNDLAYGRVGVALALPAGATFARGLQELALLQFDTTVVTQSMPTVYTLGFGDQPVARQVADPQAVSLLAFFTNGPVTLLPTDIEGDTSPRPAGDRSLTINDWVQAGRFVAGLDVPASPAEFQRVDCAPRATRGDGQLKVTDWVQAGRYFARLDPLTSVGGPSSAQPLSTLPVPKDLGREILIQNTGAFPGLQAVVPIELQSQGDENGIGFTLRFDPARLQFASASLGTDASTAGASLNVNSLQAASGSVGLLLALPAGAAFSAGTRQIFTVSFAPQFGVTNSSTASLSFGDSPVVRAISDAGANELPATFLTGALSFNPLPSLAIALSGSNLVLSWPAAAAGFEVQTALSAADLAPNWTTVPATPQTNANTLSLTLPISDSQRFYRLRHP